MSESVMPESPLDVLSRAASMVESGSSSPEEPASPRMISASPPTGHPRLVSSSSFKEIHPKFRKHSQPVDYLLQAEAIKTEKFHRQSSQESRSPPVSPPTMYTTPFSATNPHLEEAPLDFSIRKRSLSPTPPPPYKYSNPLRQHSPPAYRSSQSPPVNPTHLPVNPAPSYSRYPLHKPPAYPRTPSPPTRPPPPTYEAAIASKPVSPGTNGFSAPTTTPTFITLHARPSPTSSDSLTTTARPSVICSASSVKKESSTPSQEDKENNQSHELDRGRKREVTIVEESGAGDLMEEHFRKSLGEDYSKLFKESDKKKDIKEASKDTESQMEVDPVKAFKDDLDMSGCTVEDHFKKALGDTWIKLQQESEKKEKQSSVNAKPPKTQLLAL